MTSSGGSPQKPSLERLSSPTSELDSFQRDALANSPSVDIPPDAKDAVWAALAAQLAVGSQPSAQPPASGVRFAVPGAAGKAWLVVPAFIGLGALAFVALRQASPHAQAAPGLVITQPASAESVASAEPRSKLEVSAPVAAGSADPGASAPSALPEGSPHRAAPGASASAPDLEREITLLAQARSELRSGDAHAAQATLARMQSQFPDRSLRQERQVLAILAQNALGNGAAARRAALAFIQAHPESPHDAQLQRLLEQP